MYASSTDKFDFSDVEGRKKMKSQNDEGGCFVSGAKGFLLVLFALAIAVGVGIIVHFAGNNREFSCNCQCGTGGAATDPPGYLSETCKASAIVGNQALCGLCPPPTTPAPTTSVMSTKVTSPDDTMTTPSPLGPITDVFLPTSLKIHHYDVTLRPEMYNDMPETFTFSGRVVILLECMEPTDNITLHIASQNLTSMPVVTPVSNDTEAPPGVTNTSKDLLRQFLILSLNTSLIPGHMYSLEIHFTDRLSDTVLLGMYLSSYQDESSNMTKYLAVSQLQPTFARHTFPCFDEPSLKAKFSITLERRPNISSFSNMPINYTMDLGDGYLADVYEETVVMPTYLLAFVFSTFERKTTITASGTEFAVITRPELMNDTAFALEKGSMMLDEFEEYFNITYSLPKLDNIALPDFVYGAMENWGLVTYRDEYLLYEQGISSTNSLHRIAEVVAHELAHKWFGNLVSPTWWDDLWLNEGFATFLSYLGMDMVLPEWKMMDFINLAVIQRVMTVDSLEHIPPIYREAYTPSEILSLFDIITYYKGAAVIRMMWFFLGPETFRKGLTGYLKEKAYGNVAHDDLWAALQMQATADGKTDFDIKSVMDSWILQKNYPLVHIRRANGGMYLTQERFVLHTSTSMNSTGYSWHIPFTFTTSQEMAFNKTARDIIWMMPGVQVYIPDADIKPDQGWVLGNIQQYGYFRVNYDQENWDALIHQLNTDHEKIHVVNRGALISDVWTLSQVGMTEISTAFDMLIYLRNETEYIPWSFAYNQLEYPDTMLFSRPAYGNFERFMLKLLEGRSLNVSVEDNRPTQQRLLSSLMFSLSCKYGVEECLTESTEMFNAWKNNGQLIPPDVKPTVLCNAVREGGEEEWNFVYDVYLHGTIADKPLALSALACTRRRWIISRLLEYVLQPKQIRKQDLGRLLSSLAKNYVALQQTLEFVLTRWRYLVVDYGIDVNTLNNLIVNLSNMRYSDYDIAQIRNWRDVIHPAEGPYLPGFDQALETMAINKEWHSRFYDDVNNWLLNNA